MGCGASTFNNKSHSELSTSKPSILYEIDFDPSYEEISLKSMIFKHVMADPTGRQFFKKYLQKEHAEENIMFYEAVENLKLASNEEFPPKVIFLTEEFLLHGVDCEVNISDHMKKNLINLSKEQNILDKKIDYLKLLNKAQYEISIILSLGAFPRFLKSSIFKDYRIVLKERKKENHINNLKNNNNQFKKIHSSRGVEPIQN